MSYHEVSTKTRFCATCTTCLMSMFGHSAGTVEQWAKEHIDEYDGVSYDYPNTHHIVEITQSTIIGRF
jgi:hypothetical protein